MKYVDPLAANSRVVHVHTFALQMVFTITVMACECDKKCVCTI